MSELLIQSPLGAVEPGSIVDGKYKVVSGRGPVVDVVDDSGFQFAASSLTIVETEKENVNTMEPDEMDGEKLDVTPENFGEGDYILGATKIYEVKGWEGKDVFLANVYETTDPSAIGVSVQQSNPEGKYRSLRAPGKPHAKLDPKMVGAQDVEDMDEVDSIADMVEEDPLDKLESLLADEPKAADYYSVKGQEKVTQERLDLLVKEKRASFIENGYCKYREDPFEDEEPEVAAPPPEADGLKQEKKTRKKKESKAEPVNTKTTTENYDAAVQLLDLHQYDGDALAAVNASRLVQMEEDPVEYTRALLVGSMVLLSNALMSNNEVKSVRFVNPLLIEAINKVDEAQWLLEVEDDLGEEE